MDQQEFLMYTSHTWHALDIVAGAFGNWEAFSFVCTLFVVFLKKTFTWTCFWLGEQVEFQLGIGIRAQAMSSGQSEAYQEQVGWSLLIIICNINNALEIHIQYRWAIYRTHFDRLVKSGLKNIFCIFPSPNEDSVGVQLASLTQMGSVSGLTSRHSGSFPHSSFPGCQETTHCMK